MALRKMKNSQINLKPDNQNVADKQKVGDEKSEHRKEFEDRIKKMERETTSGSDSQSESFKTDSEQIGKKNESQQEQAIKIDKTPKKNPEQAETEQKEIEEETKEKKTDIKDSEKLRIEDEIEKLEDRISEIDRNAGQEFIEEEDVNESEEDTKASKIPEKKEKEPPREVLDFGEDFLWGTSTSAYQVEGGNKNDWSVWERSYIRLRELMKEKKKSYDYICDKACDSYNRFEEDLDLARKLNNNAIRIGIEWSRIEPKENTWNVEEINHYRKLMEEAKKRNLKIVCTLWHWTNPLWLTKEDGWENKSVAKYFSRYTELVIKELGGYIDYWVTLNEPMLNVAKGYLTGEYPPNKKSIRKFYKAINNLAKAHNESYKLIHKHFPESQVGLTMLSNYFGPARAWMPIERAIVKICNYFTNDLFLNKIKSSIDFIGLDYYKWNRIVWYPPFKRNIGDVSTMGWEVRAEGIYHVIKYLKKYNKPILITENGLADSRDKQRADFIKEHLYWVHKAIAEGVDVRGYFHWSLLDNFEWAEGYGPKFGLYEVNRDTFKRTARPSAKVYAKICRTNKLKV